jgi:hypothetical protein
MKNARAFQTELNKKSAERKAAQKK